MSTAIKFENISKQYRLGLVSTQTLSHDLKRWYTVNLLGKEDPYLKIGDVNDRAVKGSSDYVWALKNIDFEVQQGDVLGIIGKNGAGKSTLLKILSKVTAPTTGIIKAKGRIASLLEVGTGFHPEMTGRENIYMNGAIMGMSKAEITRKLDEIVDFSGVERYIDTPAKRYSSGMTVRLGFAIAAHLDPEILVVDEVLAVGDAEFQKKAIGKMQDVAKGEGRTVLFVSHNMTAVKSLCKTGIILENGLIVNSGLIDPIVSRYLKGDSKIFNHKTWEIPVINQNNFELSEIGIRKSKAKFEDVMRVDDELEVVLSYKLTRAFEDFHITLLYKDEQGNDLFTTYAQSDEISSNHEAGEYVLSSIIPANFFNWGNFAIDFYAIEKKTKAVAIEKDIISFTLVNREYALGDWMEREPGEITPRFSFSELRRN